MSKIRLSHQLFILTSSEIIDFIFSFIIYNDHANFNIIRISINDKNRKREKKFFILNDIF
jgi:hypothetical protein